MARDLIDENYYITQGGRIPVKWTAPEVSGNPQIKAVGSRYHIVRPLCWSVAFDYGCY